MTLQDVKGCHAHVTSCPVTVMANGAKCHGQKCHKESQRVPLLRQPKQHNDLLFREVYTGPHPRVVTHHKFRLFRIGVRTVSLLPTCSFSASVNAAPLRWDTVPVAKITLSSHS